MATTYLAFLRPTTLPAAARITSYLGHTDVKELALYIEDQIKAGNWDFNLGLREDLYNGLTDANQTEPRVGIAYNIKPSATVLASPTRARWRRPSTKTWSSPAAAARNAVLESAARSALRASPEPSDPGFRNEFHASLQQAFGKYAVFSGEYIWKYTHNAFDFSILGNTPITFPIDWHNSKIPGYALHAEVPNFTASAPTPSCLRWRRASSRRKWPALERYRGQGGYPFRIDHDEKFNQTTHLQYTVSRWQLGERPLGRLQLAL